MDNIELKGMEFYGYHGIDPIERKYGQKFIVDLTIYLDLSRPSKSDNISDTINYSKLFSEIKTIIETGQYHLLEKLAAVISERILTIYDVDSVQVSVKKPNVPIAHSLLDYASVTISRQS